MKPRKLRTAVAFTAGTLLAAMGGSALAQSSDDMRKQIEDLQRQLQILKDRLDKQEAAQPRPSAPAAPAQPSSQPQTAAPAGYSGGGLQLPADIPGAWQGWYAGASFGIGSLKSTWNDESGVFFGGDASSYSGAKAVGSLRGGYNWVQDRLLLGMEMDINSGAHQSERDLGGFTVGPGASTRAKAQINWYSTLRARAGVFASPDALLYVTGGVAYGKQTSKYTFSAPGLFSLETDPTTSKNWGYTVGTGVEYRLAGNMSLTAEYAYVTLRQFNSNISDAVVLPGFSLPFKMTNSLQTGRIGLNWRF